MSGLPTISVDDSTGSTVAVEAYNSRSHMILRFAGDVDVWVGWNEPAEVGKGVFFKSGEVWTDTTSKWRSAMYFVTGSGESATVYVETEEG